MGKDQDLLEASRNGNIAVVEKILNQRAKRSGPLASLRRGPGANVQDSSGYSALHHAALNGHKDIVQLLLTHEASKNIVDVKGSSPLHLAAWTGNIDIVRLLLCHGPSVVNVNLTTKDNETALHCAAHFGHTDVVHDLLQNGCDPAIRNTREETALDLAAQYGRLDTVELLVRTHPDLIRPYAKGECPPLLFPHTPLHLASRNGHKAVVAVLLAAGLDVNVRTSGGTALHEAALCGKMEVVRTLLDEGVDLAIRDSHHNTVMDLLGQFPAHVTHDITAIIKRHRGQSGPGDDPLPPIPVPDPTLGSPYENVRITQRGSSRHAADSSSPGTSPTHWDFYHHHAKTRANAEDRRISGTSMSVTSDSSVYQTPPYPKSLLEASFRSDDMPMYPRDLDQMSVSSTASSTGPSPRDRRFTVGHDVSPGIYMTMGPGHGHRSHSPVSNSKVSPTPPKKPPRRNLSVSPTHPTHLMTMSADGSAGAYEYLFLARSGVRSHSDLEELHGVGTQTLGSRMVRRGRSTDQYVEMRGRHGVMTAVEAGESFQQYLKDRDDTLTRRHVLDQPIAITATYGDFAIRTTNPRRKLRRSDRSYENCEPTHRIETSEEVRNSVAIEPIFVSNAYITLKSSQESLLEDGRVDKRLARVMMAIPTSPTHYKQPPTPDHPPPSAMQAEKKIHECIKPLSQEYKRRSRDIETETDEDVLLFPSLEDASSGSLSSSVSLSDKSASTDNHVEEFVGDAPFAGLLKGSKAVGLDGSRSPRAERPKTLRRLNVVYDNPAVGANLSESGKEDAEVIKRVISARNASSGGDVKGAPLSILSPFDEQEEWAKISEIMASFGTGLVRESVFVTELEQEFQSRLGLSRSGSCSSPASTGPLTTVAQWLTSLNLADYESIFISNGFDDIDFICGILDCQDLKDMGIDSEKDCETILESVRTLPCKIQTVNHNHHNNNNNEDAVEGVDEWLSSIRLEGYSETFAKHLYVDMARVKRIWEVELTAVLEIHKAGHRKRILASVAGNQPGRGPNLDDINADLNQLQTNIQQLKEEIRDKLPSPGVTNSGTLRSSKKSRPAPQPPSSDLEIRDPSELLVGVPPTLTTQWRHQPAVLVTGAITYIANYLGSTVVKELRGTESTKKSIQKLKKSNKEPRTTPDIVLAISYRGVKFLNTLTEEPVCEHEIRNIHCACQDADDLTHFAYITKDHASKSHFCHVFCVETMDQATEVILTLGQAFEVAYQMAIRDQLTSRTHGSPSPSPSNHARSRSDVKVNGQAGEVDVVEVRVTTPLLLAPIASTEEL